MVPGINIQARDLLPVGKIGLVRDGELVWVGSVGSPISDAEFDTVLMNPTDIERLKMHADKFNRRADIIRALLQL
jgi:hypothetical protein